MVNSPAPSTTGSQECRQVISVLCKLHNYVINKSILCNNDDILVVADPSAAGKEDHSENDSASLHQMFKYQLFPENSIMRDILVQ
jgi:hypothetical protein